LNIEDRRIKASIHGAVGFLEIPNNKSQITILEKSK
jgi:hypothetical protein